MSTRRFLFQFVRRGGRGRRRRFHPAPSGPAR